MIKPKKSLGQNFLVNDDVINKITSATSIKDKFILEIGPGTGNLTKSILKHDPKQLIVIEKDENLSILLNENFKDKITIFNNDILKFNEKSFTNEKLTVFGNLPYNISTEILCKWIINLNDNNFWFHELILMFQKEVADRIIAKYNTSNYGRLTILANWKLKIKKICDISPNNFFPKPRVDSTLLHFFPNNDFIKFKDPKNLEKITKIFFNQRRKMIKKPFNQIFNGDLNVLNKYKLDLNLRPQNLSFDTYYKLTCEYENLRG